jgi:outer membrane murein-binding lipoprotein Lpp
MQTKTQKLLTGVLVLQGLLLAGQFSSRPAAAEARGEVALSNPSERQLQMVEELKSLNAKMDKLTSMLGNGEVTVKVAKDEK